MLLTTSIHFLVIVFLGILILVLMLIVAVLLFSFFRYKRSLRVSEWLGMINEKISEVIVYADEKSVPDQNFQAFSGNLIFRNLFLHKLVDAEKKFSGTARDQIKNLFSQYDLQKEAFKKLNQKKAHLIAGGIQELTVMESEEALAKISSFLIHPSPHVYQEAQYAMVNLKGFGGLEFLDTASGIISEWQQLRLLISIPNIPEDSGPAIAGWLSSTNDSVIIFTLKLLRKFQMLAFYPTVIRLMDHSSVAVRIQAVQTLLSLENASTMGYLAEIYPDQPDEVQVEILRVMKISKDQACTGLLKKELSDNIDPGIKVHAAEALFSLGHQEYLRHLAQDESSSEELIQIVKYALQEKVC
ncbi:hypothetical protein MKJ01_02920 [Chryseobacterium sp. SSA4.19]|uniref:hypothetical protein n=1 Tax=Chryseobacterium sp. SSA4.19 TaxID=2919915 RepID=UPI001F4E12EC|nr:hypothetical protein [Chryseobacterium sp. SSA4.19]MCJ8152715.1 hypothetical protein [Chryseobacterium sp. SSA4.19]